MKSNVKNKPIKELLRSPSVEDRCIAVELMVGSFSFSVFKRYINLYKPPEKAPGTMVMWVG